jgi:salicylate biosynthesis isochorismate synthase
LLLLFHDQGVNKTTAIGVAVKQALAHCRRSAEQSSKARLLRIQFCVPDRDPWLLLGSAAEPWSAWYDGSDRSCAATFGIAYKVPMHHSRPFSTAREECSQIREHSISLDADREPLAFPLAFGGFSFDASSTPLADPWTGWERNQLFVPKCLIWRKEGLNATHAVVSFLVDPEGPLEAPHILATLDHVKARWQTAQDRQNTSIPTLLRHSNETQEDWNARITALQSAIAEGLLEKAVLARSVTFSASKKGALCPIQTLQTLRRQHPGSYCFAFSGPDGSAFVGASPETLLRTHEGWLSTHALAGTTQRGKDAEEDESLGRALLLSHKERGEQAFVVQAIEEALSELSTGISVSAVPSVHRLAQMQHLVTPIRARLTANTHLLDAIERLHPTPAVGGWPTRAAKAWLAQHESIERAWYAAPVGWLDSRGNGVFAVAIRSALFHAGQATAFAGAGIVAESNPQAEWDETELKLQTIAAALRQAEVPL